MNHYRLQTNRASLVKLLSKFRISLSKGDYLVAPRPLPKQAAIHYIAYCRVVPGGINEQVVTGYNKWHEITEETFSDQVEKIAYSWKVGGNGV